jgi:hypothetical protein
MAQDVAETEMVRVKFFDFAFQYYVAGRFAVSAGLVPVAGNLFHHGIEMFLKGALSKHWNEKQRRGHSHGLAGLWAAFKHQLAAGDHSLASFDRVVEELSKFEEIRYPEKLVLTGMACTFGFGKATPTVNTGPQRNVPEYQLFVGEIDALVKTILTKSGVNPQFYTRRYREHGSTFLRHENQETSLW